MRRLHVAISAFGFCETHAGSRLKFGGGEASSLHYCLSGEGTMRLECGTLIPMADDVLVLLPAMVGYAFEAGTEIEVEVPGDWQRPRDDSVLQIYRSGEGDGEPLVVACCEVFLHLGGSDNLLNHLAAPVTETGIDPGHLRRELKKALAEMERSEFGARALLETQLKEVFIRVLRRHVAEGDSPLSWVGAVADSRLSRVMSYMNRHLAQPLTVEAIAAQAGMSRTVLYQQISKAFGKPPIRLLYDMRLARAAELLSTTDTPVGRIANDVGYRSRSHFTRDFRERYSVDPSAYRKRYGDS